MQEKKVISGQIGMKFDSFKPVRFAFYGHIDIDLFNTCRFLSIQIARLTTSSSTDSRTFILDSMLNPFLVCSFLPVVV